MAILPATQKQHPELSILDQFNKQVYLGNSYSVTTAFTATTSELPVMLLANNQTPIPSSTSGISTALFQNFIKVIDTAPGGSMILRLYANPIVSAPGTPLTPFNLRFAYPNQSIATASSVPTVTSNGVLVGGVSAIAQSEGFSQVLKILDPGQSLLITALASAGATTINVICQWYEL